MKKEASLRGLIIVMAVLVNIIIIENGFIRSVNWYYLLTISLPALAIISARRNPNTGSKP